MILQIERENNLLNELEGKRDLHVCKTTSYFHSCLMVRADPNDFNFNMSLNYFVEIYLTFLEQYVRPN